MTRHLICSLIAGLILLTPAAGIAQQKKKNPPPPAPVLPPAIPATPDDYAQLNQQKEVLCKIITIDPSLGPEIKIKRNLVFRFDYKELGANPNYRPTPQAKIPDHTKEINKLQKEYDKAFAMKKGKGRDAKLAQIQQKKQQLMQTINQQQMAAMAQDQANKQMDIATNNLPLIQVAKAKEVIVEVQPDVFVRRLKPAAAYDDKGYVKEYKKEELDKLQLVDNKDKKKPGYPAKYEDLLPGQTIVIGLTPGKPRTIIVEKAAPPPAKPTDKPAPKETTTVTLPPMPTVRMIVIVEDIANPNNVPPLVLPPLKK